MGLGPHPAQGRADRPAGSTLDEFGQLDELAGAVRSLGEDLQVEGVGQVRVLQDRQGSVELGLLLGPGVSRPGAFDEAAVTGDQGQRD